MSHLYDDLRAEDGPRVRLVILESIDVETNEVICRLKTVRFITNLQYRALSYCWGDKHNAASIICNGVRRNVTDNLNAALHCLLRQGKARNIPLDFWIDAICINQENNREKETQVSLMGDIFRQALEVIVWLGPAGDDSDFAFEACQRLCLQEMGTNITTASGQKKSKSWIWRFVAYDHIFFDGNGRFDRRGVHNFVRELDAVQAILVRPWWSRIWIIQEVALARRVIVICGDAVIDWATLDVGITACINKPWSEGFIALAPAYYANVLFQVRREAVYNLEGAVQIQYPLCYLLSQFRWSMATNARDKVYGLIGLASIERGHQLSDISYSKDVESCYRTAMLDIIRSNGSLDILQLCRKPPGLAVTADQTVARFPSWMPDLSMDTNHVHPSIELLNMGPIGVQSWPGIKEALATTPQLRSRVFRASNGSVERNPILKGDRTLIVQGFIFDIITAVSEMKTGSEARRNPRVLEQYNYIREVRAGTSTAWKYIKSAMTSLSGVSQDICQLGAEKLLQTRWKRLATTQTAQYPTGEPLARAFACTMLQGWLGNDPEGIIGLYNKEWNRTLSKVNAVDQSFLLKGLSEGSRLRCSIASLVYSTLTLFKDPQIPLSGYTSE
ncbi:putative Heterokaryon incompatibility protein-domain-containing protein [Seiridium cardinale]